MKATPGCDICAAALVLKCPVQHMSKTELVIYSLFIVDLWARKIAVWITRHRHEPLLFVNFQSRSPRTDGPTTVEMKCLTSLVTAQRLAGARSIHQFWCASQLTHFRDKYSHSNPCLSRKMTSTGSREHCRTVQQPALRHPRPLSFFVMISSGVMMWTTPPQPPKVKELGSAAGSLIGSGSI